MIKAQQLTAHSYFFDDMAQMHIKVCIPWCMAHIYGMAHILSGKFMYVCMCPSPRALITALPNLLYALYALPMHPLCN